MGSLFQVAAYAIDSPAPPFPVMVFAYFLAGLGIALQVCAIVRLITRCVQSYTIFRTPNATALLEA